MSQEVTTYTRKATFQPVVIKGQKMFKAVNKRAHHVVKNAGKREYITAKALKALKGKGSYTFHQYTTTGSLKKI